MGTEVLSVVINIIVQTLLIAFVFALLYKFAWKSFLRYLHDRQDAVISAQEEARLMKEEATTLATEAKAKLQEINQRSDKVIETAEETAKQLVTQQRETAQKEINRKLEVADKQVEQERRRLEEEMQEKAVELASELAAQFLETKASEAQTEQQIESFLKKMGE